MTLDDRAYFEAFTFPINEANSLNQCMVRPNYHFLCDGKDYQGKKIRVYFVPIGHFFKRSVTLQLNEDDGEIHFIGTSKKDVYRVKSDLEKTLEERKEKICLSPKHYPNIEVISERLH